MALDAFDLKVFSFKPELRIAAVVELQVLAPPALDRMAGRTLRSELSAVGVLVAVRAELMPDLEGRHVHQAVLRRCPVALAALDLLVFSIKPERLVAAVVELQVLAPPALHRVAR